MSKSLVTYFFATIMVIGVVLLYKTSPVRFFSIDLYRRINDHLFLTFRNAPRTNPEIIILNISELPQEKIIPLVDVLLTYSPKKIGINLCHFKKIDTNQFEKYSENSSIIIANCTEDFENSLSRKIESGNKVTHFKADRSDYYEFRLLENIDIIKTRNNKTERINFIGSCSNGSFFCHNLVSLDNLTLDFLDEKILLLGYGDSQYGEDISSFTNARITPMNKEYGEEYIPPDMFDTEISANIIACIYNQNFLNEVSIYWKILILLFAALVQVTIVNFIKTRWLLVNLAIAILSFFLLNMAGSILVVYLFTINYYIELHEMTLLLILVAVFTFAHNLVLKRKLESQK
jgi:hypothetical protein